MTHMSRSGPTNSTFRLFNAETGEAQTQENWAAKPTVQFILAHAATTMVLNTGVTLALSKGLKLDPYTLTNTTQVVTLQGPVSSYEQHSPAVVRPVEEVKYPPARAQAVFDDADVFSSPEPERKTRTPKFLSLSGQSLAMDDLRFEVAGTAQDAAQARFVDEQPTRRQVFPPVQVQAPVERVSSGGRFLARAMCSFVADVAATTATAYIPGEPAINWFLVEPVMSGVLHATASKLVMKEGFLYALLVQTGAAVAATSIVSNPAVLPHLQ